MKCAICEKNKELIVVQAQHDDGEKYNVHVCDTCWDVIHAISLTRRKYKKETESNAEREAENAKRVLTAETCFHRFVMVYGSLHSRLMPYVTKSIFICNDCGALLDEKPHGALEI